MDIDDDIEFTGWASYQPPLLLKRYNLPPCALVFQRHKIGGITTARQIPPVLGATKCIPCAHIQFNMLAVLFKDVNSILQNSASPLSEIHSFPCSSCKETFGSRSKRTTHVANIHQKVVEVGKRAAFVLRLALPMPHVSSSMPGVLRSVKTSDGRWPCPVCRDIFDLTPSGFRKHLSMCGAPIPLKKGMGRVHGFVHTHLTQMKEFRFQNSRLKTPKRP